MDMKNVKSEISYRWGGGEGRLLVMLNPFFKSKHWIDESGKLVYNETGENNQ